MARLGLGEKWQCLLANEICPKKARSYRVNHTNHKSLVVDDVANLHLNQLPPGAQLAWASFPCQDLSLAGNYAGLKGERSSTFWPFMEHVRNLVADGRPLPVIVLENVVGALISNKGADFEAILQALADEGYLVGPLVINAIHFVPQSRPRLFIVAVLRDNPEVTRLRANGPHPVWHPKQVVRAYDLLRATLKDFWVWWSLPDPPQANHHLEDLIEVMPDGVRWHSAKETERLLSMMSEGNLKKVHMAKRLGKLTVGTIYKRTRRDNEGKRVQRAEIRFDQISGCLRTPAGGSSRQIIMLVKGNEIRSRLISPREAARLMGLADNFILPERYNEAYHLLGDGLVVPVVSWLEKNLLNQLAAQSLLSQAA